MKKLSMQFGTGKVAAKEASRTGPHTVESNPAQQKISTGKLAHPASTPDGADKTQTKPNPIFGGYTRNLARMPKEELVELFTAVQSQLQLRGNETYRAKLAQILARNLPLDQEIALTRKLGESVSGKSAGPDEARRTRGNPDQEELRELEQEARGVVDDYVACAQKNPAGTEIGEESQKTVTEMVSFVTVGKQIPPPLREPVFRGIQALLKNFGENYLSTGKSGAIEEGRRMCAQTLALMRVTVQRNYATSLTDIANQQCLAAGLPPLKDPDPAAQAAAPDSNRAAPGAEGLETALQQIVATGECPELQHHIYVELCKRFNLPPDGQSPPYVYAALEMVSRDVLIFAQTLELERLEKGRRNGTPPAETWQPAELERLRAGIRQIFEGHAAAITPRAPDANFAAAAPFSAGQAFYAPPPVINTLPYSPFASTLNQIYNLLFF